MLTRWPISVIMRLPQQVRDSIKQAVRSAIAGLTKDIWQRMKAMADQIADLNTKVTKIEQDSADLKTRVATQQTALQAAIDDLKAHPAAPDLTSILARLDSVSQNLESVDSTAAVQTGTQLPGATTDTGTGAVVTDKGAVVPGTNNVAVESTSEAASQMNQVTPPPQNPAVNPNT